MDIIGKLRYIAVKTAERKRENVIGNLKINITKKELIKMKVPMLVFIMMLLLSYTS